MLFKKKKNFAPPEYLINPHHDEFYFAKHIINLIIERYHASN